MHRRYLPGRIAAGAMMVALLIAPTASGATTDDAQEIGCLALTIYHEARGESERGKLAVGHVVMNRAHSLLFPTNVCDVVRQGGQQHHRCQFSWWCDGNSDRPKDQAALQESLWLAERIYYGCTRDPTAGALWYHSTAVKPSWSKSFGLGQRIDRHVFYRGAADRPIPITASMPSHDECSRSAPVQRTKLLAGS
jgi:spore germination cell wall hydrolase CwlJ-like protein